MSTNPRRIEQIKSLITGELSNYLLKHTKGDADFTVFDVLLNAELQEAKVLITTTALVTDQKKLVGDLQRAVNQFGQYLFKKSNLKRHIKFTVVLSDTSVFDNLEL